MICPKCEYEFVNGINECPDCVVELVTVEDFVGNLVNPKDWVIIKFFNELYNASMYKANLEGAGIETMILEQRDRNFVAIGDLAVIKLLVKKPDAEDAIKIIEDIDSNTNTENTEEE